MTDQPKPLSEKEIESLRVPLANDGLIENPYTTTTVKRLLATVDAERSRAEKVEKEIDAMVARLHVQSQKMAGLEKENARLAAALERARETIEVAREDAIRAGIPVPDYFRETLAAISDPSACLEQVKREARAEAWMEAAEICRRQSFVYLEQTESMGEPEFSQLDFASSACFYLEKKMKSKATLDGREG